MKTLEAAGRAVTFVDIRKDADLSAKVPVWLAALGADLLVNKRSTTWRGLDAATRASDPEALLIANATLIKRPVIETGNKVHVGWTKETQDALF
ncbi:MAG: ArsC/Spx/MgsR family protein, partial [Hyphomonadaceae bacterium]